LKNVFDKFEYEYDYNFDWSIFNKDGMEEKLPSESCSPEKSEKEKKEKCEKDTESNLINNIKTLTIHKK
jgi:hypothetical protein